MYAQRKLILSFEKQRYVGQKKRKQEKKRKKEENRERFRKNEFVNRSRHPSGCTRAKVYFRNCRDVLKHTFGQERETGILFEFIIVIVPVSYSLKLNF